MKYLGAFPVINRRVCCYTVSECSDNNLRLGILLSVQSSNNSYRKVGIISTRAYFLKLLVQMHAYARGVLIVTGCLLTITFR